MQNQPNQEVSPEQEAAYQATLARCIPVAKGILKIIVEDDLSIGDEVIPRDAEGKAVKLADGNRPQAYVDAALKIQKLMLDANLKWGERHLVFMLVKQPMDMLQNVVLTDLETTYQANLCRMFGIEVLSDLDFKMIDEFCAKHSPVKTEEVA